MNSSDFSFKNNEIFSETEVNETTALELGLTEDEYRQIVKVLGRTPSYTEIGIYGVMWSEHCSYKNSIKQLKTLPRSGGRLLVEAGAENAGLVDIGNGYAIAFKIESHNHPSAIEPFEGAATGVGGILRDIFSMGARPIAALNSLRFGELNSERTKFLLKGVVHGISHYGNSFGVPTVGGEIYFEKCYQDNPLVNAMAVGIVRTDKTATATASGEGNPVFIIGSSTGRDGIHGASLLASREFDEKTDDMRPTVQVGDPFAEKLLLEASIELIESGVIVGIQDMGAAGISCSTSEMSAKGEVGMDVNLDLVPLREKNMSAYEIMLSESQERMLIIVDKGREQIAIDICKKWDIPIKQIGVINGNGKLNIFRNGNKVAELNADSLVLGGSAPQYDREAVRPEYLNETENFDFSTIDINSINLSEAFIKLLNSPNIASKRWVYEQYDSQVRTNTVSIKGDAAIIRLKELPGKGIAVCTDCNSRYVYLNPYQGAMASVAEAARNVVCAGATPVAITNCLNFGNPYDKEVYWQFKEVIRGMGDACRKFNTPVTGGNVSFHNESQKHAIFPTPVIGMLGVIENLDLRSSADFKNENDKIFVLGWDREEFGGSEFIKIYFNKVTGQAPVLDIDNEINLQATTLELINQKLINSAHDCSEGGLAITLAEKAISSGANLGCKIVLENATAAALFGESQSRIVISAADENIEKIKEICLKNNLPLLQIGEVVKNTFSINNEIEFSVEDLRSNYENAIPNLINKKF
ncbi:MAG: phosphoribosylformylglycinamidine synthase subunit PurL [Candidatus Kapabacteria bacterium]|nr:phosphoribosylformylglycinamidine synthase subunit PurL [Candidatus Kapabacteria bacterium]